jgi:hypothetical protein
MKNKPHLGVVKRWMLGLGVGTIFKIKIILIFFTFKIPERKHTVIVHLDVYLV